MELVYQFKTEIKPGLSLVGGKGMSLILMTREGLPVPQGFVLSVAFFEPWLEYIKKSPEWAQILKSTPEELLRRPMLHPEVVEFAHVAQTRGQLWVAAAVGCLRKGDGLLEQALGRGVLAKLQADQGRIAQGRHDLSVLSSVQAHADLQDPSPDHLGLGKGVPLEVLDAQAGEKAVRFCRVLGGQLVGLLEGLAEPLVLRGSRFPLQRLLPRRISGMGWRRQGQKA